jgi:hypothetical protein
MVPVARSALPPLDNGWRTGHRADALSILFMLAAETNAAGFSFFAAQTKNPPSSGRWIRVDALGDFHLIDALTKLSSKRAANPIYHGLDRFSC